MIETNKLDYALILLKKLVFKGQKWLKMAKNAYFYGVKDKMATELVTNDLKNITAILYV